MKSFGRLLFPGLILFWLLVTLTRLDFNSVFLDEAFHIILGRQVLSGQDCPACPYATGTVLIHPVLAAIGDHMGGLQGARAINLVFALLLALVIFKTADILFGGNFGTLAAAIFLFSSQTLYLSRLATYDMTGALFLGTAFLLLLSAEMEGAESRSSWFLAAGAFCLFLASITKYLLPVFIPPFLAYVFYRHGSRKALLFYFAPLFIFLAIYVLAVLYPAREAVAFAVLGTRGRTQMPFSIISDWAFRWVAMAYLLSAFGAFHSRHGRMSLLLIVFSSPIILLHLVTGSEQSLNKNVIFALVFLSPAAALGIDYLADIFALNSITPAIKNFYIFAIMLIVCAYGIHNMRWLENQYPNLNPVIELLRERGHDGMLVATIFGDDVYRYALNEEFPSANFIRFDGLEKRIQSGTNLQNAVDFYILDNYYVKRFPFEKARRYVTDDYSLIGNFTLDLSWGTKNVEVYRRR